jgi:hypothetical protein
MRKVILMVLTLLLAPAAAATAQDPGQPSPRAEQLRKQIEARFTARVKQDLGLSDQQTERLRGTTSTYLQRRRELERQERELKSALAGQLRPGVAADADSVSRLTDALLELKVSYAQSFREENRELAGFLSPVQRAQFQVLRERLLTRIEDVRIQRQARTGQRGVQP